MSSVFGSSPLPFKEIFLDMDTQFTQIMVTPTASSMGPLSKFVYTHAVSDSPSLPGDQKSLSDCNPKPKLFLQSHFGASPFSFLQYQVRIIIAHRDV